MMDDQKTIKDVQSEWETKLVTTEMLIIPVVNAVFEDIYSVVDMRIQRIEERCKKVCKKSMNECNVICMSHTKIRTLQSLIKRQ